MAAGLGCRAPLGILAVVLAAACTTTPATPATTPSNPASPTATPNPASPTATPSPSTSQTEVGLALRSAFEPPFSLTYSPIDWTAIDTNQPDDVFLQYVPTQEALQFIALDNVAATPCDSSSQPAAVFSTVPWNGAAPSDFISWLKTAAGSALIVSDPQPVTLGGASGLRVDLQGKGAPDCMFVRISMWAADNSLRISTSDPPSRVVALDVKGKTVLIWFHGGPTFEPVAEQLLSKLVFQ